MQTSNHWKTHGTFCGEIALTANGQTHRKSLDFPSPCECPQCHRAIEPIVLHIETDNSKRSRDNSAYLKWPIYAIFRCQACSLPFYAEYEITNNPGNNPYVPTLVVVGPSKHVDHLFAESISDLSPMFCKIYNQSIHAEEIGLSEIAGPGYRKALEFLVKDYAISNNPDAVTKIQSTPLTDCIKQYIDFDKIRLLAEKSAWIGNDLTHYSKKHEDLDIDDLKRLINAMVSYIDSELLIDFAESIQKK